MTTSETLLSNTLKEINDELDEWLGVVESVSIAKPEDIIAKEVVSYLRGLGYRILKDDAIDCLWEVYTEEDYQTALSRVRASTPGGAVGRFIMRNLA